MKQGISTISCACLSLWCSLAILSSAPVNAQDRHQSMETYRRQVRETYQAFRDVVAVPRMSTVRLVDESKQLGLGTIVTADGWIVTKASQAGKATVAELADGKKVPVRLVGTHQGRDLAVMKMDGVVVTPVLWSQTVPLVGDWMASVETGVSPVSVGVLSVSRRPIASNGEHGVLGIELERTDLAQVRQVYANSGAESAGLAVGDIVIGIDDVEVSNPSHLVRMVRKYRPGDTIKLKVRREESELELPVTLTHPFGGFLSRIALQNRMGGELSFRRDDFEAVYQTDSVISPENCGGPVVGLDGRAVGINIARAGRTETYVIPQELVLATFQEIQSGQQIPGTLTQHEVGKVSTPAEATE